MKTIDILTTAVPRATISRSFETYLKHLDFTGYHTRWFVNLDRVPSMEDGFNETIDQINNVGAEFDEFQLETCEEPSQLNALLRLMRKSENDCLLLQDDRLLIRSATIDEIYALDRDYVNFTYKSVSQFSLSPCFVKKSLIQLIVNLADKNIKKGKGMRGRTAEKVISKLLRGQTWYKKCLPLMEKGYRSDIGVEAILEKGLKKDYSASKIQYVKNEDTTQYALFIPAWKGIKKFDRVVNKLCLKNQLTVFYLKEMGQYTCKRYPGVPTVEVSGEEEFIKIVKEKGMKIC
jgi:hypothetical protein